MRGISWLAANQLASEEGLCTMEWVSKQASKLQLSEQFLISVQLTTQCASDSHLDCHSAELCHYITPSLTRHNSRRHNITTSNASWHTPKGVHKQYKNYFHIYLMVKNHTRKVIYIHSVKSEMPIVHKTLHNVWHSVTYTLCSHQKNSDYQLTKYMS